MNPYPFERQKIEIDHFKYTFVTLGNSTKPVILFLHNGGGDHRSWYYQLKDLSLDFYCIGLDLPGFGGSDRPERAYSVEWIASQVLKFMVHQFQKPISIVGHCIGGAVALEVASIDPARVESLLAVNVCVGPPGMSGTGQAFYKILPKNPRVMKAIYPILKPLIGSQFALKQSLEQLFSNPEDKRNLGVEFEKHIFGLEIQHINRRNLLLGMPSFAKYSRPFVKDQLNMPIEIVWSEKNTVMKPAKGKWLSQFLQAPIHWLNESRHMAMNEQPEEFNRILRQLMKRVSQSKS